MTCMRKNTIGAMVSIGALVAGILVTFPVSAALLTYFGEDLATGRTVPPAGNAVLARNSFLSALSASVGTESFEALAIGATPPFNFNYPGSTGSISATLTAADNTFICGCDPPAAGEFATSGLRWLATGSNLNIAFSSPISAFGFFGTDIGDSGGQLTLALSGGITVNLGVPAIGRPNNTNGDLLFFGFIDTVNTYTNIAIGNSRAGTEFFGIDDITVGDAQQVAIAEPAGAAIFALGLICLGWARRRTHPDGGFKCVPRY